MAYRKRPYRGNTDLPDRRVTVRRGRGVRVEFAMNRAGIRKIALGPELLASCRSVVVRRAMPFAIRNSPRGRRDEADLGAAFVASWRVSEGTAFLVGMKRVAVKLINVAPHAAAVEFINPETGRGHGYGVLARTLAHLHAESGGVAAVREKRKRAAGTWKPDLHPRGPKGRFVPKDPAATPEAQVADSISDAIRRWRRSR